MRLWSLHPEYLDSKGLVALWRESLLAQKVLLRQTRGYKNHPQLERFKQTKNPEQTISSYLWAVADEADNREYSFNKGKILKPRKKIVLTVTEGQLNYEFGHLRSKLEIRTPEFLMRLKSVKEIKPHPIFKKTTGGIEYWEKI